ncbi:hypothetical protein Dsin_032460 [Dipteronia sinensis]|uniref:RNase H type-1 domain-containing protein n=1 Tax=Dipteronia sinensis TaxID=43782 RepID=A0AAD9ZPW8_9ROSI|nr:hypothetical protein Dsin_032460 [Dipteronia sinensis]
MKALPLYYENVKLSIDKKKCQNFRKAMFVMSSSTSEYVTSEEPLFKSLMVRGECSSELRIIGYAKYGPVLDGPVIEPLGFSIDAEESNGKSPKQMRCLSRLEKKRLVKDVVGKHKPMILFLQETKLDTFDNRVEDGEVMRQACDGWKRCKANGFYGFVLSTKIRSTKVHMKRYILSRKKRPYLPRNVAWSPPTGVALKFNVDGLARGNPRNAGLCGVIRDNSGKVLGLFSAFVRTLDSNSTELLAIHMAASLCALFENLVDTEIEIVNDSKVTVSWVNSRSMGCLKYVNLIYDIRNCLSSLSNMWVIFNSRASNSFADSLAKQGSAMERTV